MATDNLTKSPYETQADDFLAKHNIKFSSEFIENGKHFPDDTDKRDIYNLTLTRNGRSISFRFGQSIVNSPAQGKELAQLERKSHYGGSLDWQKLAKAKRRRIAPTAYDLLASIQKYSPGGFKNFCAEYGYSDDSIKARDTWQAVVEEWFKVESFFSPEELTELLEIN